MSFFLKGNSPPTSPPKIVESHQPVETNYLSTNSRRMIPTAEEFLNDFNEADKMATFSSKELIDDSKKNFTKLSYRLFCN